MHVFQTQPSRALPLWCWRILRLGPHFYGPSWNRGQERDTLYFHAHIRVYLSGDERDKYDLGNNRRQKSYSYTSVWIHLGPSAVLQLSSRSVFTLHTIFYHDSDAEKRRIVRESKNCIILLQDQETWAPVVSGILIQTVQWQTVQTVQWYDMW